MVSVLVPCENAMLAITTDTLMANAAKTTQAMPVPLTDPELFK